MLSLSAESLMTLLGIKTRATAMTRTNSKESIVGVSFKGVLLIGISLLKRTLIT